MVTNLFTIIIILYAMLPAYVANMMPVFVRKLPFLNVPIDGGNTFRGRAIFGKNKTVRGFVFGILGGVVVSAIQYLLPFPLPYDTSNVFLAGVLLSSGALVGDVVKSFFKRQMDIPSGTSWFPFDEIDYSIGALVFVYPVFFLGAILSVFIIFISAVLHVIVNTLGYFLGVRERWW